MAETLSSGTRLSWAGGLDAAIVEEALSRLRYEAAGEPEGGEGLAIRTNLFTLVICASTKDEASQAAQAVFALPGHHPSRTLVISADPGPEQPRIDVELAAHCHTSPGLERHVCCEEVELTVAGPPARHLHSIVAALLVPDLPVHLWWRAPLPQDWHVFQELASYADRLILDSARLGPPPESLRGVAAMMAAAPTGCATGDFNWGRTLPWREVVARHAAGRGLPVPSRAHLTFAGGARQPPPAHVLLLAGWLAAQAPPGLPPVISATPGRATGQRPGTITSLVIEPAGGRARPGLSVQRIERPPRLRILARLDGRRVEECLPLEEPDDGQLLAHELDALGADPEYRRALAAALEIAADVVHRRRARAPGPPAV